MESNAGTQTKKPRFAELKREQMTEEQKRVYDEIKRTRGVVGGPFHALLRSPELTDRWQAIGEYIRFKTSVPKRLNEFAILITARARGAKYEWYAHKPFALKAGLAESITADLAQNRRPADMKPDEELVYDFCTAVHRQQPVDDAVFRRAIETLGEQGVIDLVAACGFYTAVSMVLNVAEVPLPPGAPLPW